MPLSEGNIDYREQRGRDSNSRYHKGTVDFASAAFNHSPWIFLASPLSPRRPLGLTVVIKWSSPWNAFYSTRCHRKRRDTYALPRASGGILSEGKPSEAPALLGRTVCSLWSPPGVGAGRGSWLTAARGVYVGLVWPMDYVIADFPGGCCFV
jgi:hypothetical protein